MTDGVARELEQAEARLADARSLVTSITLTTAHWSTEEFYAARDGLIVAAIEVGRLRAIKSLTLSEALRTTANILRKTAAGDTWALVSALDAWAAALAAREEVQGVERQIDAILERRADVLRELGEEVSE